MLARRRRSGNAAGRSAWQDNEGVAGGRCVIGRVTHSSPTLFPGKLTRCFNSSKCRRLLTLAFTLTFTFLIHLANGAESRVSILHSTFTSLASLILIYKCVITAGTAAVHTKLFFIILYFACTKFYQDVTRCNKLVDSDAAKMSVRVCGSFLTLALIVALGFCEHQHERERKLISVKLLFKTDVSANVAPNLQLSDTENEREY